MTITFIQTADAFRYADMIAVTSRTVRVYAEAHGCAYEQFLGLKKGRHPWHACFNRIFMLSEMIERGVGGWVCHMDADAWINDLHFDLAGFLADKQDIAMILAPSQASDHWWDVNDGVFLINLDHPSAVRLVAEWKAATLAVWDRVANLNAFPKGGPDDQSLLHSLLADGGYREGVLLVEPSLINSPEARFIRQHLRSSAETFKLRIGHIKDAVAKVLAGHDDHAEDDVSRAWTIVDGLYLALMGRPADGGRANPYVQVILNSGARDGIELVARYMIDSDEFGRRYATL